MIDWSISKGFVIKRKCCFSLSTAASSTHRFAWWRHSELWQIRGWRLARCGWSHLRHSWTLPRILTNALKNKETLFQTSVVCPTPSFFFIHFLWRAVMVWACSDNWISLDDEPAQYENSGVTNADSMLSVHWKQFGQSAKLQLPRRSVCAWICRCGFPNVLPVTLSTWPTYFQRHKRKENHLIPTWVV